MWSEIKMGVQAAQALMREGVSRGNELRTMIFDELAVIPSIIYLVLLVILPLLLPSTASFRSRDTNVRVRPMNLTMTGY